MNKYALYLLPHTNMSLNIILQYIFDTSDQNYILGLFSLSYFKQAMTYSTSVNKIKRNI